MIADAGRTDAASSVDAGARGSARFSAALEVAMRAPEGFLDHLAGILADHMPPSRRPGAPLDLSFYGADARLEGADGALSATARSDDRGALANMKYLIAWNLREFLGDGVEIAWKGEGAGTTDLPQFRQMTVVDAFAVTPKMRRVRLTGHDLSRFAEGGLHVQILIPPEGRVPVWPSASPSGIPAWPEGEDRLTSRTYTIRRLDPRAGFVDIDVVLHEGASPGSDWARTARPGDPVGMMGPGGGGMLFAERMLVAGDETALPAIARMLEEMPDGARGTALIEINDDAERQKLVHPPGFDVVWLDRRGRPAGTTTLLEEAIAKLQWPGERRDVSVAGSRTGVSVWVGCEFRAFKRVRHQCRKAWGLKGKEHLVVAYWRRSVGSADVAA